MPDSSRLLRSHLAIREDLAASSEHEIVVRQSGYQDLGKGRIGEMPPMHRSAV